MKPRTTLIVVAVFALLAAYLYFVELNKTPEQLGTPTPRPSPSVFKFAASDIKTIQVSDLQSPRQVRATRTDTSWQVEAPTNKPGDTFALSSTAMQFAGLFASRVITTVTDLAPFGLVTPTLEVRLTLSDTTQYALTIGNKTPDGSNYYAMYTGGKEIFVVNASAFTSVLGWLDNPPYEPTPTPTFTPTPLATPTSPVAETPTAIPTSVVPPPAFVPTLVPQTTTTPKP